MSDHFYGINVGGGADPSSVTVATSTTGLNVELRVHDGVTGNSKVELLKVLEAIVDEIILLGEPA